MQCISGYGYISGSCIPCIPGTYSAGNSSNCLTAPAGSYVPFYGSGTKLSCATALFPGAVNCPDMTISTVSSLNSSETLNAPRGITVDTLGNIYVADVNASCILKFTAQGGMRIIAGSVFISSYTDGVGSAATFYNPEGLAIDSDGNVYVADTGNNAIRKISPSLMVTSVAGSGVTGHMDGYRHLATFNNPTGLALDSSNNIFVADSSSNRIRKINSLGYVTTVSGFDEAGITDGLLSARFNKPSDVAVDSSGNVYVADLGNNLIRMITPTKRVSTIAGYKNKTRGVAGCVDGVGTVARFRGPTGIAIDAAGNLYVADAGNNRLRYIVRANSAVDTVVGSNTAGYVDGSLDSGLLNGPVAVAVGPNGNPYIADLGNAAVRKIADPDCEAGRYFTGSACQRVPPGTYNPTAGRNVYYLCPAGSFATGGATNCTACPAGTITAYAGLSRCSLCAVGAWSGVGQTACAPCPYAGSMGAASCPAAATPYRVTTLAGSSKGFSDGAISSALLNGASRLCLDTSGNLLVGDTDNNRVRQISPTGLVTTVAGGSSAGYADGLGSAALFSSPTGVAADDFGNIFVTDSRNHVVRVISPNGMVTTLVGGGVAGFADGVGRSVLFKQPGALTVVRSGKNNGTIYVVDYGNNAIRQVSPQRVVTTLAGSTVAGGADGLGTSAFFQGPKGIGIDRDGNLFVGDNSNFKIRKITSFGLVTTLAGGSPDNIDGVIASAAFYSPAGIAVDRVNNVYVTDMYTRQIRLIAVSAGQVSTLAGSGGPPGSADGLGTAASFALPNGLAVDAAFNVYVADVGNNRIRKLSPQGGSCKAGYYPPGGRVSGCEAVPAGYFSPSNATGVIFCCPSGSYSLAGASACSVCPGYHLSAACSSACIAEPTPLPTGQPTSEPFIAPTRSPEQPTSQPSGNPSGKPSRIPTPIPSALPSPGPSTMPTPIPTSLPAFRDGAPTPRPSKAPTLCPTVSSFPSPQPSAQVTAQPTSKPPTPLPSSPPTTYPSPAPTTAMPTVRPSTKPTSDPTRSPTYNPTFLPGAPTPKPTLAPTPAPSTPRPSALPTLSPIGSPSTIPTPSPSAKPSPNPTTFVSVAPTIVPTPFPSTFPTIAPSAKPSTVPSYTPSAKPTIRPSPNPSYTPGVQTSEFFWRQKLKSVLGTLMTSNAKANANALIYSEARFDGRFLAGGCGEWNRYFNELSLARATNRVESIYVLEVSNLKKAVNTSVSFSCSSRHGLPATLKNVFDAFAGSVGEDAITACDDEIDDYTGVRSAWDVSSCRSAPAICVNCEFSNPATDDAALTFASLSPCGVSCLPEGYQNASDTLSQQGVIRVFMATLEPVSSAPYLVSIAVVASARSVLATVELDSDGQVYCAALTSVPKSTAEIIAAEHSAWSTNLYANMTIGPLVPSTAYTIYCASVSATGEISPVAESIGTSIPTRTLCCKTVTVSLSTSNLNVRQSVANFAVISLEALPAAGGALTVSLPLQSKLRIANPYLPRNVTFTSTSPSKSVVVGFSGSASAGQIRLGLNISGSAAKDFAVKYPSGNDMIIQILGQGRPVPAPDLLLAQLSSDGTLVTITYDSKTDRGGATLNPSVFPCSSLYQFPAAAATTCQWSTDGTAVTFPAMISPLTKVGDTIAQRAKVLRAACPNANATACIVWPTAGAVSVVLQAPGSPVVPAVAISAPQTIGPCDALVLDLTGSVGSGGRPWASWSFRVTGLSNSSAAVQSYLNQHYTMVPPSGVPPTLFQPNHVYLITAQLCNFLGACGRSSVQVTTSSVVVPTVSILGPATVTLTRAKPLVLSAAAYVSSCSSGAKSLQDLSFTWTINSSAQGSPATGAISTSTDASKFLLPAYALNALESYSIVVTVTYLPTSKSSSAHVAVIVKQGALVAVIAGGGGSRMIRLLSPAAVIDASASYDEDQPNFGRKGVAFAWSCQQVAPVLSLTCALTLLASSSTAAGGGAAAGAATLSVLASTRAANSTNVVMVTIADATPMQPGLLIRRAQATVLLVTVAPAFPLVSATAPRQKVNVNQDVVVLGDIDYGGSCLATWSVDNPYVDLSSVAKTPVQSQLTAATGGGEGTSSKPFNLVIAANSLPAGSTLTFQLSCAALSSSGPAGASSLQLSTNAPPLPGKFAVTPATGTELLTQFTFTASYWTDPEMPLAYEFSFQPFAATVPQVVKSLSLASIASSFLPAGASSSKYVVACMVRVVDSLGADASAAAAVTVTQNAAVRGALANFTAAALLAAGDNVDATKQIIAAVGATLTSADCSGSPVCAGLNRASCASTSHTCGSCLPNYEGTLGDSNEKCVAIVIVTPSSKSKSTSKVASSLVVSTGNDTSTIGQPCTNTTGCHGFESCDAATGFCVLPKKTCINSCTKRGVCSYVSLGTGATVRACTAGSPLCAAVCSCNTGFYGADCSLTMAQFNAKQQVLKPLLTALTFVSLTENVDVSALGSWAASLLALTQNPSQLSTASSTLAVSLSERIVAAAAAQAIPLGAFPAILPAIDRIASALPTLPSPTGTAASALSSTVVGKSKRKSSRKLSGSSSSSSSSSSIVGLTAVLDEVGKVAATPMVPGQLPTNVLLANYRLAAEVASTAASRWNANSSVTVSLPWLAVEAQYGLLGSPYAVSFEPGAALNANTSIVKAKTQASQAIFSVASLKASLFIGKGNSANSTGLVTAKTITAAASTAVDQLPISNILRAQYSVSPFCSAGKSSSVSSQGSHAIFTFQHDPAAGLPFIPVAATYFSTSCVQGTTSSETLVCPTGQNITVVCDGSFDTIITTQCPVRRWDPVCVVTDSSFPVAIGSQCNVVNFTASQTVCSCSLCNNTASDHLFDPPPVSPSTRRKLLGGADTAATSSVLSVAILEVTATASYTDSDFITRAKFGITANAVSKARNKVVVQSAFIGLWGLLVVLAVFLECGVALWELRQANSKVDGDKQGEGAADGGAELDSYVADLVPHMFSDKSRLGRLWHEMKLNHPYVTMFMQTRGHSRWIGAFEIGTNLTTSMYLLSLFYDYQWPSDDGRCGNFLDETSCTIEKTKFNPDVSMCAWESVTFHDPHSTSLQLSQPSMYCVWRKQVFDVRSLVIISLVVVLISVPAFQFLNVIFKYILLANGGGCSSGCTESSSEVMPQDEEEERRIFKSIRNNSAGGGLALLGGGNEDGPAATAPGAAGVDPFEASGSPRISQEVALRGAAGIDLEAEGGRLGEAGGADEGGAEKDDDDGGGRGGGGGDRDAVESVVAEVGDAAAAEEDDALLGGAAAVFTRGSGPGSSRLLGPLAKKRQRACVRLSVDAYELGRSKANSELEPTIIPGDVITFLIAASKYEKTLKGRSLERFRNHWPRTSTSSDSVALWRELRAVDLEAKDWIERLKEDHEDHIGATILDLFTMDLLGRDSLKAKVYANKVKLFDHAYHVPWLVQLVFFGALVLMDLYFIQQCLFFVSKKPYDWSVDWVVASIVNVGFDAIMNQVFITMIVCYSIPSLIIDAVAAAKCALNTAIANFYADRTAQGVMMRANRTARGRIVEVEDFSAPDHLFVSLAVARAFPQCLESAIVLAYKSPTVSSDQSYKWCGSKRSSAAALNSQYFTTDTMLNWLSVMVETPVLLLGSCYVWFQKIVVGALFPGALAAVAILGQYLFQSTVLAICIVVIPGGPLFFWWLYWMCKYEPHAPVSKNLQKVGVRPVDQEGELELPPKDNGMNSDEEDNFFLRNGLRNQEFVGSRAGNVAGAGASAIGEGGGDGSGVSDGGGGGGGGGGARGGGGGGGGGSDTVQRASQGGGYGSALGRLALAGARRVLPSRAPAGSSPIVPVSASWQVSSPAGKSRSPGSSPQITPPRPAGVKVSPPPTQDGATGAAAGGAGGSGFGAPGGAGGAELNTPSAGNDNASSTPAVNTSVPSTPAVVPSTSGPATVTSTLGTTVANGVQAQHLPPLTTPAKDLAVPSTPMVGGVAVMSETPASATGGAGGVGGGPGGAQAVVSDVISTPQQLGFTLNPAPPIAKQLSFSLKLEGLEHPQLAQQQGQGQQGQGQPGQGQGQQGQGQQGQGQMQPETLQQSADAMQSAQQTGLVAPSVPSAPLAPLAPLTPLAPLAPLSPLAPIGGSGLGAGGGLGNPLGPLGGSSGGLAALGTLGSSPLPPIRNTDDRP